ncbi:MAG: hypothetical protein M3P43_06720 [Actinomycetota bacterium]|nr:hypothetical protein [Actinomycetota bacterium]
MWENLGDEIQTWFREGDVLKQNDHVFCDASLGRQLRDVWTAPDAAETLGLSDHAPFVLDFEVPSIAMTNLSDGNAPES